MSALAFSWPTDVSAFSRSRCRISTLETSTRSRQPAASISFNLCPWDGLSAFVRTANRERFGIGQTGDIATGTGQTRYETGANGIEGCHYDNGNRRGRLLGRQGRGQAMRDDD